MSTDMEFQDFPKMARLARDVIVTEKIDGTNAQVCIGEAGEMVTLRTHKARSVAHHCRGLGCSRHHVVGDTRELGDERGDVNARVHQALKPVHHATLFGDHDGHLGGAVTQGGRDA